MKKVAYMSAVLALLVFSGCSTKEPTIDASAASTSGSNSASNATTMPVESSTGVQPTAISDSSDKGAVIAPVTTASTTDATATSASNSVANAGGVNSVYFDFDKYDIREDMQAVMMTNSGLLKGKSFKLEGNCDEFGSDEYNFALGLKRANSVKTALVNNGVDTNSISMVSLGEGNPACSDKTQECWAKNRRVDVKLP